MLSEHSRTVETEGYRFPSVVHGEGNAGIEKSEVIRRVVVVFILRENRKWGRDIQRRTQKCC